MENHEFQLTNEKELHYKVVDCIKIFKPEAIFVPGLGESQKISDKSRQLFQMI